MWNPSDQAIAGHFTTIFVNMIHAAAMADRVVIKGETL